MSYALLGNVAFDVLNAPTQFSERHSASFVTHEVLAGKPRLQAMGLGLTEITLQIALHHQLGSVDGRYQALLSAKNRQEALALVLGQSVFKGHFVITDISSQSLQTDAQGQALRRDVSLTLMEFIGNTAQGGVGAALRLAGKSPLAALLPASATQFYRKATFLISKGIQVYRQTRRVIGEARQVIQVVKGLRHHPLEAIEKLPAVVANLAKASGNLAEVTGFGNSFRTLANPIIGTVDFLGELSDTAHQLRIAKNAFEEGIQSKQIGNWVDRGEQALGLADRTLENLARPTAKLTAWVASRSDKGGI